MLALLLQICGIIIWPVMNMNWKEDSHLSPVTGGITTYWVLENSWGLPLGLFLTSFGYWESFVDENQFSNRNFLWRVKINMIEEGARYTSYLFISIWKMALFLCLFLLLSTTVVRLRTLPRLFKWKFCINHHNFFREPYLILIFCLMGHFEVLLKVPQDTFCQMDFK